MQALMLAPALFHAAVPLVGPRTPAACVSLDVHACLTLSIIL